MNKGWYLVGVGLIAFTAYLGGEKGLLPSMAHAQAVAGPNVVEVVASDFKFEMPDTLPAGPTLFRLSDTGKQLHHVTLVKLEQGKTLDDFSALPPGPLPAWAVLMGGPNTPTPNDGYVEVIVDLIPGNYAAICVIPDAEGKPHMMQGMVKALTVTPSTVVRSMPAIDLTLTLTNYHFGFSKPLTAGEHVMRVVNDADQPHEAVMFRLQQGKKGEDIAHWVETGMQGPPPGAPVAGISAAAPSKENILLLKLRPGDYALLCFMPDAKDGRPHMVHGMIYNFSVS